MGIRSSIVIILIPPMKTSISHIPVLDSYKWGDYSFVIEVISVNTSQSKLGNL
jgi:hypothetical protein